MRQFFSYFHPKVQRAAVGAPITLLVLLAAHLVGVHPTDLEATTIAGVVMTFLGWSAPNPAETIYLAPPAPTTTPIQEEGYTLP